MWKRITGYAGRAVTRAEKARRAQEVLNELFPRAAVPLSHRDPYTLLIAVLLSAQCTDKRVNEVTPGLFAKASTPAQMDRLTVAQIRSLIRSCGLAPQKARAIKSLSRILLEEHAGKVPDSFEKLEELPGVGHKTASVVMVQAFGRPAFPVDTHIHRLSARWGLSSGANVVRTERDLKKLFAPEDWGRVHLQMIYFGREYCPARGHDFSVCPICSWAASRARQLREQRHST